MDERIPWKKNSMVVQTYIEARRSGPQIEPIISRDTLKKSLKYAAIGTAVAGAGALTISAAARERAKSILDDLKKLTKEKVDNLLGLIRSRLRPEQKIKEDPEVIEDFVRSMFEIKRATEASKTEAGSIFYGIFGNLFYNCFGDPVEEQSVLTAKKAVAILEKGMSRMNGIKIELKISEKDKLPEERG